MKKHPVFRFGPLSPTTSWSGRKTAQDADLSGRKIVDATQIKWKGGF
jgi:hypothetical protein